MGSRLTYGVDCRYQRPVSVVRAHFLDMRHHIAHDVHKGVHYTILDESGDRCRLRQKFKVLGMTKTDEIELSRRADGAVVQDYLKGDFAGGTLTISFTEDGADATRLHADFDIPLRGMNRLLKPILLRTVKKLVAAALEEDRVDLEVGKYQPTGWAATQAAGGGA
jgi:hypothetical protein